MAIMTAPSPKQDLILKLTAVKTTNHLQTVMANFRAVKRALTTVVDVEIDLGPEDQHDGGPTSLLMISTNGPVEVQIQMESQTLTMLVTNILVLDQPILDFIVTNPTLVDQDGTNAKVRVICCK